MGASTKYFFCFFGGVVPRMLAMRVVGEFCLKRSLRLRGGPCLPQVHYVLGQPGVQKGPCLSLESTPSRHRC